MCDVSIIDPAAARPAPNPNVLIELGYALKVLGPRRIILVMNTAYGGPEKLPFDLRQKRVSAYSVSEATLRAPERRKLASVLTTALKTMLPEFQPAQLPAVSPGDTAISSIQGQRPDQAAMVRKYMLDMVGRVSLLDGWKALSGSPDDNLVEAIEQSTPIVAEFVRVTQSAAEMGALDAATALYRGFDQLLSARAESESRPGIVKHTDSDLWNFLAHELLVCFVAMFLREERWELIGGLLNRRLSRPHQQTGNGVPVHYGRLSKYVSLLEDVRRAKTAIDRSMRVSVHADILSERHGNGPLAQLLPKRLFEDADYLLYLRSVLEEGEPELWRPGSALAMGGRLPAFISTAHRSGSGGAAC